MCSEFAKTGTGGIRRGFCPLRRPLSPAGRIALVFAFPFYLKADHFVNDVIAELSVRLGSVVASVS